MIKVAIIGAGVLGQHIAHMDFRLVGFYDDYQERGTIIIDVPILGSIETISSDYKAQKFEQLLIGIGYNHLHVRQQLFDRFSGDIPFATYMHPSSYIDCTATIGEGVMVLPGCVFDKNVQIGNNVFFNIGCLIAHDSIIKSNNFFAPGVKIAGFVTVGNRCFLGIDTTIINNVHLGDDIQTGGGTVVTSDISTPGLYVGTPAKFLKNT